MDINVAKSGPWTVVSVAGEIDLHHSPDLRAEVVRQLDAGTGVLLDMSEVTYIDSSGIAMMAQALSHSRKAGIEFALLRPTEPVLRILRLTKLDKIFTMHDDVPPAPGS